MSVYLTQMLLYLTNGCCSSKAGYISRNQQGVNSFHYEPSPLSPMEFGISDFLHSYIAMLSQDK